MPSRLFTRHDRHIAPWSRLLDAARAPLNLTGATVVYSLKVLATGLNKINRGPAIVRDQQLYIGEVFYQFTAADVDTELVGTEEWEVTWSDGFKESFPTRAPVRVVIMADLDNV
jgi:hypothetical protein